MNNKLEQLKEYAKIIKDAPYALRTYLQTYDNTQKKNVPLELFPDQIQLIKDYETYNENITRKYRQAGVTTVTAAWVSKKLQTASTDNPEKVLIIANKKDTAVEMANKIRNFIGQWPEWINVGFSPDKNSESRFKLNNGCEVKAVATSKDALRGYTPTILIFDEAAYIEAGEDFWAASMASLSCVHEDSYILTDKGLYQLKEIVEEKEKIGFTDYNGDLKVINHNLEITDIKSTFKSEKAICYKIKTKNGLELIGSYKHPLLVKETENNDEWVWMENLKVGDEIKIQYNQNLFGDDKEINFEHELKRPLPKKLGDDLELSYLMGLFISDGFYENENIIIKNDNPNVIKFLLKFGFKSIGENLFIYYDPYLKYFFENYIGINNNYLPSFILQSSRNVLIELIRGILKEDFTYSNESKELLKQLQIILSNLGIKTVLVDNELIIKYESINDYENIFTYSENKNAEYYYYDKIDQIDSFEDYTYDLEIPNGNSFIANSIISHNTGGKIILISCVTKETYVFTENGLQQVEDFIDNDKPIGEGYIINEYNIRGKDKTRKSNIILNNGKQKTLKIKSTHSFLEGTLTHKVWAYSKYHKKYDWYQLSDLTTDDYINVNYGFNLWGDISNHYDDTILYNFGSYISDSKEKYIENVEFTNFLNDINYQSNEKYIPKELLKLNKNSIINILKGLFDNDGFIYSTKGKVGITSSSKKLIEQIRMLLLNFGVLCEYEVTKNKNIIIYKLLMNRYFSKIFYEEIGFNDESKQEKYKMFKTVINDEHSIIPDGSFMIKKILKDNDVKKSELRKDLIKIYDNLNKSKNITKISFEKMIKYFKNESFIINENLDGVLINNSRWEKIKSIEESEEYTYDFSLYNDDEDIWCHSILYNGILGHQTPNGYDPIYYGVFDQAMRGLNDFHITDLRWFKDPRYSKDLVWVKCEDIVHYMLNRNQYDDEEVVLYDFEKENYNEYLEAGYKPYSPWFESMAKKFKYDKKKIAQEIECVDGSTEITVREKSTGIIKKIRIEDFYNSL